MKVYVKRIIMLSIVVIGFLLITGCRDYKQFGELDNNVATNSNIITETIKPTTVINTVDDVSTTSSNETVAELIDIINSADSLDELLDIYGQYTNRIDGAYAEAYSYNLLRLYKEVEALEFIKALSARGWAYINVNSKFLAGEAFLQGSIESVRTLKSEVEEIKSNTGLSSMELNTLTEILAALEEIQLANETVYNAEKSDFTIWKSKKSISLYDIEDIAKLQDILGEPKSINEEQLGDGSDTFAGSFIKELSYDGIKLWLFAPEGDEKAFWIYNIIVTGKDLTTAKGIGVGNSVLELKKQYPNISVAKDGRQDENNCAFEISKSDEFLDMTFEIKDGKIVEIDMLVEFP